MKEEEWTLHVGRGVGVGVVIMVLLGIGRGVRRVKSPPWVDSPTFRESETKWHC